MERYSMYGEHDYSKDNTWVECEEDQDGAWVKYEDVEKENKEMMDCIHNLMALVDSPIGRRRDRTSFAEEVRKIGRNIMEKNGRTLNYGNDEKEN